MQNGHNRGWFASYQPSALHDGPVVEPLPSLLAEWNVAVPEDPSAEVLQQLRKEVQKKKRELGAERGFDHYAYLKDYQLTDYIIYNIFPNSVITVGPDGVQLLAEGLCAGALPAVMLLQLDVHVGDAGASALAAALDRGALRRLRFLFLTNAAIGDAGLVALALALRRRPALETLSLFANPLGDEGLAALLAPPPPAGTLPLPTGGLKKLKLLDLEDTQVTDAGCAALTAALHSGALPALKVIKLDGIPASDAAKAAVYEARANLGAESESEDGESEDEWEEWEDDVWSP